MDDDSYLETTLLNLEKLQQQEMIHELLTKSQDCRKIILAWLEKTGFMIPIEETEKVNDALLFDLWEKIEDTIADFNEQGGGDDEKAEEVDDTLDEIETLLKTVPLSSDGRQDFIDEAMLEFKKQNSSFEDEMVRCFFSACKTKEDWEFLIKKLEEKPTDWDWSIIRKIYQDHLQDDETYLALRSKILKSGNDYWELVTFYRDRQNAQKAREIAEIGIEKGQGRLDDLFEYLTQLYTSEGNQERLEYLDNLRKQKDPYYKKPQIQATQIPQKAPQKPKKKSTQKPKKKSSQKV